MYDTVGVDIPVGVIVLCFNSGDANQIAGLLRTCRGDQATVAVGLVKSAQQIWIGLTPHAIVVERVLATVEAVSTTMERMQAAGK